MKQRIQCICLALLLAQVPLSWAAFQNAQTGIGNQAPTTQVAFKNTPLKDVLAAVVPPSWLVQLGDESMGHKTVSIQDTGSWDQIVQKLAQQLGWVTNFDTVTRTASLSVAQTPTPKQSAGVVQRYQVSSTDQNIRKVITRWAKQTGWTFSAEHWAPNVDIPVIASDTFETDFKTAVRRLTRSTELTEYAVQPCFYSNYVVRVVPIAEQCDRTK